jgi:hypothetical protein
VKQAGAFGLPIIAVFVGSKTRPGLAYFPRPLLFHEAGFEELVHILLSEIDALANLGMGELMVSHEGIDESPAATQISLKLFDRQNVMFHR